MISVRQQAGQFPLSLPLIFVTIATFLFVVEFTHGQPNYYFKAGIDTPAVKSLPRIGRRSEDGGLEAPGASSASSGVLSRSLDFPSGAPDMWGNSRGGGSEPLGGMLGSPGRMSPSLIAPLISAGGGQLDKSLFWRRILGDLDNYEEALLENLYRSKS